TGPRARAGEGAGCSTLIAPGFGGCSDCVPGGCRMSVLTGSAMSLPRRVRTCRRSGPGHAGTLPAGAGRVPGRPEISASRACAGGSGSALDLSADEGLDRGATLVVGTLHRRGLHEVRRRRQDRATDAAVLGDLGRPDGVDDDAGRVGGVPD